MSIIKFPDKGKAGVLKQKLDKKKRALSSAYSILEDAYGGLNELELRVAKREERYNDLLLEYAEAVGDENVELEYLEYSSRVKARRNDKGEIELYIETS